MAVNDIYFAAVFAWEFSNWYQWQIEIVPRVKLRPVFESANLFHSSENDGIFDRIDFRSSERYSNYDIYFSSNTHTHTDCVSSSITYGNENTEIETCRSSIECVLCIWSKVAVENPKVLLYVLIRSSQLRRKIPQLCCICTMSRAKQNFYFILLHLATESKIPPVARNNEYLQIDIYHFATTYSQMLI